MKSTGHSCYKHMTPPGSRDFKAAYATGSYSALILILAPALTLTLLQPRGLSEKKNKQGSVGNLVWQSEGHFQCAGVKMCSCVDLLMIVCWYIVWKKIS